MTALIFVGIYRRNREQGAPKGGIIIEQSEPPLSLQIAKYENQESGANDGIRTRDHSDHNRGLYQLSYVRHKGIDWLCYS